MRNFIRFVFGTLTALAVLMIFLASGIAFAADAASVVTAAQPVWLSVLLQVLPYLLGVLIALHPLLKLAGLFHAMAQEASGSALKHAVGGTAEYMLTSIDHYLEESGQDLKDLTDESKRAAAVADLKKRAIAEGPPMVLKAVAQLGESWLAGKASQAVDVALAGGGTAAPAPAGPK
jgi:hypothetical protein